MQLRWNYNKSGYISITGITVYLLLSCILCAFSGPNGNGSKQPAYPGFERDVLKTVADYFQRLKEPLLTYHLYEVFVNILSECFTACIYWYVCEQCVFDSPLPHVSAGLQQQQEVATEALQLSTLLLPPPNRRRIQLLLRLMARVCQNPHLPPLNDAIATRTLVHVSKVLTFCLCFQGHSVSTFPTIVHQNSDIFAFTPKSPLN